MSNQQKQPDDPPTEGAAPTDNPAGQGQRGIVQGQEQHEGTAWPNSGREGTETATNDIESGQS